MFKELSTVECEGLVCEINIIDNISVVHVI
jgi:hypothetical protein